MSTQKTKFMISIIIPVYKVEKYLDECVSSLIKQTYHDIEVILVDDGSPDKCPQICDEWAKKDVRIKVVHKKNGGLSSARNAGIAVAKGEYIGFVDSDDYVNTTMYEDLMRVMKQDERIIVVSSPLVRDVDGKIVPYKVGTFEYKDGAVMSFSQYMQLFLGLNMDATVTNKLFQREFIQTLFREGRNNEDYLFMYYNVKQVFDTDKLLAVTDKAHYYYRDNVQSICHQVSTSVNRLFFDELYNLQEIAKDLNVWNAKMCGFLMPLMEGILIHACDQMLKFPILRVKRPQDCQFIDGILQNDISLFRKGRPFSSTFKLFLFKYFPKVYLLKSKIQRSNV